MNKNNLMGKIAASFEFALSGKTLEELVVDLARARQQLQEFEIARDELVAELELELCLAEARHRVENAKATKEAAEQAVRERAIIEFKAQNVARPHPNVQIKQYTVLDYEVSQALEHCRNHLPNALKLDKRKFDKVAKVTDLDFVEISKEPRASISRDLSPLLEEE